MVTETELFDVARRQHGLVTTRQARRLLTPGQLQHRIRRRRLEPVRSGVLRVAGSPDTWEQQLLAAVLAGGPGTVASFRAAASLWALAGLEARGAPEITVRTDRRARLPGAIVHDSMVMRGLHRGRRHGISTTSVARTLCDLTAICRPFVVERALDDALRRELTTVPRLEAVFHDLAHRGRRRSTVMRALLEARLPGLDPTESPMEARLVRWVIGADLPRPVLQHPVRVNGHTYRLDLAFPELMIGIEYDGWDTHRPRSAFDGDRKRQNPLEILGWLILRYTSKTTRDIVITEVRAAIAARQASK